MNITQFQKRTLEESLTLLTAYQEDMNSYAQRRKNSYAEALLKKNRAESSSASVPIHWMESVL